MCAVAGLALGLASGAFAQTSQSAPTTSDSSDSSASSTAPAAPQFSTNPFVKFFQYQAWEIGKASGPSDPNAPPSRRPSPFPPAPETTPPMPFTEWPYGGATVLGANRPNSVDSPLMAAISDTSLGKFMSDAHLQLYGWVDVGGNISSSTVKGGNAPGAYDYNPNTVQLDQAARVYFERTPDTVQTDHVGLGLPAVRHLRCGLSIHDGPRCRELSATEEEQ